MRRKLSLWVSSLFLLLSSAISGETISIAFGEWPPYVSKDLPSYGIAAELATAAFRAVDIQTEYIIVPWNRALLMVENGEADATILWVWTEEREKKYLFSDIFLSGKAVFFHRVDMEFDWEDYSDLEGYNIGGLLSASYPWLNQAVESGLNIKMELVQDEIQNFSKLLYNRIDLFSIDTLVAYDILRNSFSEEERKRITYHPRPIEQWDYRMMLTRTDLQRSRYLASKLNSGLEIIKQNGLFDEIADIPSQDY